MTWDESKVAEAQEAHRAALSDLYAGRRLKSVFSIARLAQREYLRADDADFGNWLPASLRALEEHAGETADPVTFHPLLVEFWPLGVHIVDALFGARVYETGNNFWADPLPTELAELKPLAVADAPLVRWCLDRMDDTLKRLPDSVGLTTPVFASPLNIALNLYGERALMALSSPEPEDLRGLGILADAIADLHRLVRSRFAGGRVRFYAATHRYAPDGFGHICGCSTQLVGPDTYEEYLAPLDERVLKVYPEGGTIHLCGHHTQHIPCWSRMQALRAVQLNDAAADDFEQYFHGLRDDQMIYIGPTRQIPIEKILDVSGGRRIILQTKLDRPMAWRA